MKIALFGNLYKDKSDEYESQFYAICQKIRDHSIEIYLPKVFYDSLSITLISKIEFYVTIFDTHALK